MNESQAILQNIIDDFSPQKFSRFFREISRGNFCELNKDICDYNDDIFSEGLMLGEIDCSDAKFCVATFNSNKSLSERSGKKAQYEKAKKYLRENGKYNAGIFIFYDAEGNFRFSLIFDIPLPNGKRDWSSFKRFTYFVSKEQTNKTFLMRVGAAEFSSIDSIKDAFSVDKVTKDFYREIANWYFWALDEVEFPDDEDKDSEQRNAKNLIRLITRIIFVWFMKEKKLVSPALFDKPEIDKIINYKDKTGSTYYKAILQNLFFATLNTKMKSDDPDSRIFVDEAKKKGFWNDGYLQQGYYRYSRFIKNKDAFLNLFENIPFLNGGLFESLDKKIDGKEIRIDCFSDNPKNETRLKVPDKLFFLEDEIKVDLSKHISKGKNKKVKGLLPILKSYNFTIDENTPVDEEVALDPELLGKVFENLLASYNPETATTARKSTGSYYTPREIVEYMVNESLVEYLKTALGIVDKDDKVEPKIRDLFDYNKEGNPFEDGGEITEKIISAIEKVKILDPACGSGAFPMGILHKLVLALHKLDPENKIWKKRLIERVPAEIRTETEKSLQNKPLDYIRKLGLIENCIYGVDIQEIAIQISKLRFFISLLVEQQIDDTKHNRDVRSLPNLETKFVAANTLIGLEKPEQMGLVSNDVEELEKQLFKKRKDLFYANSRTEKLKLQKEEKELREKLKKALEQNGFQNDVAEKIASWDPFDQNRHADWFDPEWMFGVKDGFDVVIGNPPYVFTRKSDFSDEFKEYVKKYYFSLIESGVASKAKQSGKINLFGLFILKAFNLLNLKGTLIYIVPNNLLRTTTFDNIRKFILDNSKIVELVDLGSGIFDQITASTIIINLRKSKNKIDRDTNTINVITSIVDFLNNKFSRKYIPQANFLKNVSYSFNLFIDDNTSSVNNKISENKKLFGSFCKDIIEGIVAHNHLISKVSKKDYLPLLEGKCIKKYSIAPVNKFIKWSKKDIHRTRPDYLWAANKKIIIQRISGGSNPLTAAIDTEKFKTFASINNIILKEEFSDLYEFYLALINSKVLNWYYANNFSNKSDLTVNISKTYLENLPMLDFDSSKHNRIIHLVNKIIKSKKQNPKANTKHLEDQIDIMVYKLYELTYEEVKVIDPEIEKIISREEYGRFEIE